MQFANALESREKNCFFVAVHLLLNFSKVNGVEFDLRTNGNPLNSPSSTSYKQGMSSVHFPVKDGLAEYTVF